MRSKGGKKGWMAIKIDLEKAYDKLNWNFIRDSLEHIGFPEHIIQIIWFCVTTPTMQVLWNGEALEKFQPKRGIRQGDAISSCLFFLCIERLFQAIEKAVNEEDWKPIQVTRGGPKFSHLAFADDLIFFAEASVDQASVIQEVLHKFCGSSGQKVSGEKTRISFSKNDPKLLKVDICNELVFQMTDDLGKYLAVPIFHKRVGLNTFKFVIDKVNQRLSSWKARTLSFAGRVTRAKSVVQAMPTYVMQSCELPGGICDEVDKICRKFIWGDETDQRKIHLISWEKVCMPKKE